MHITNWLSSVAAKSSIRRSCCGGFDWVRMVPYNTSLISASARFSAVCACPYCKWGKSYWEMRKDLGETDLSAGQRMDAQAVGLPASSLVWKLECECIFMTQFLHPPPYSWKILTSTEWHFTIPHCRLLTERQLLGVDRIIELVCFVGQVFPLLQWLLQFMEGSKIFFSQVLNLDVSCNPNGLQIQVASDDS